MYSTHHLGAAGRLLRTDALTKELIIIITYYLTSPTQLSREEEQNAAFLLQRVIINVVVIVNKSHRDVRFERLPSCWSFHTLEKVKSTLYK